MTDYSEVQLTRRMAAQLTPACPYVVGETPPQARDTARFETKPTVCYTDTRRDSGGGYERWRSHEYRPETPSKGSESVYVSHHRLLAVVACYPAEMPLAEIQEEMIGSDVHHGCPEPGDDRGVPWDNRPENLTVLDHGTHSGVSNTQRRAWYEDDKREHQRELTRRVEGEACAGCGERSETWATTASIDGKRCLDCATEQANGDAIEIL